MGEESPVRFNFKINNNAKHILAPILNQSFDQISEINRQISHNTNNNSDILRLQSKDFSYKSFFHDLKGLNTPQNAEYK